MELQKATYYLQFVMKQHKGGVSLSAHSQPNLLLLGFPHLPFLDPHIQSSTTET